MNKSFSNHLLKVFAETSISQSRKGRSEILRAVKSLSDDVIKVPSGEEIQEFFSDPKDLIVMSEIPPNLVLPLARMKQMEKDLGQKRFEERHVGNFPEIVLDEAYLYMEKYQESKGDFLRELIFDQYMLDEGI